MSDQSSQDGLSEIEADTARMAAVQRLDRYLVELANLPESGFETVVGLIVSGMVVIGRTVPEGAMAGELDQHIANVIRIQKELSDDPSDWAQLETEFNGKHVEGAAELSSARVKMFERHQAEFGDASPKVTEMPRDLAREMIADGNRIALTLAEASIFPSGVPAPISVAVMRIDLRQVASWWIIQTDPETRSASFSYPGLS